jgi:hypothetical protein
MIGLAKHNRLELSRGTGLAMSFLERLYEATRRSLGRRDIS